MIKKGKSIEGITCRCNKCGKSGHDSGYWESEIKGKNTITSPLCKDCGANSVEKFKPVTKLKGRSYD